MQKKTKCIINFFLILIFLSTIGFAQRGSHDTIANHSFHSISDSLIKRELAFFTVNGAVCKKVDSLHKVHLREIPVRSCSDKEVHLWVNTFASTFIHFYFKGQNPNRTLDSISLVTHSHFLVKFPKNKFQDLSQNNTCNYNGCKNEALESPYYKAFYSSDKRRLYIYMQGGNDFQKYEVSWIIVDDKFYARIFDYIP
jgi:hypothetical protein